MAEKTIVAVAVGPKKNVLIRNRAGANGVRPYIQGLIDGLSKLNREIGTDYVIDYRERDQAELESKNGAADAFTAGSEDDLVIFGMSTTVVRAAQGFTKKIPIVGVVSDWKAEGFSRSSNISCVSGRRSQTAGQCFERFLATVPTLKQVLVLHKPKYGPSERALKLVQAAAKKRGVTVKPVPIKSRDDIEKKLSALPKRDSNKPSEVGLLVLPIDVCLGAASMIVKLAQEQKQVPVFMPISDGVKQEGSSPIGGYGAPQSKCGEAVAEHVNRILWPTGAMRAMAASASARLMEVPDSDFEWTVSSGAAKALKVKTARLV
jgi:ABC-type uncharacterized transport system substrate-binding protein